MSKQSPPVWEVIDRQQGVVGCWCVEWGEEEDEEIEDKKPAKCLHSNQLCDTFWRSDKQKSLWVWLLVDTKFAAALIRGGLVANYQRAEKIGTMRAIGLFQWQTFAVAVVCRLCFSIDPTLHALIFAHRKSEKQCLAMEMSDLFE